MSWCQRQHLWCTQGGFRVWSSNGQGVVGRKASSHQYGHRSLEQQTKGMPFSHSKASVPPQWHNGMISHSPNRSENTKKEHEPQSPGSLQHSLRLSSDASKTHLQPCGGVRIPSNYDPTTIEAMYAMQYCQNRTITFLHFRGWTRHKHLQNRSSWMNVPTLGWTTYGISSCVASSLMIVAISAFLKKFG